MELDELHIGETRAGAMRDRVSITSGDLRIGRVSIDLPTPASRQHRRVGDDLDGFAGNRRFDAKDHSIFGDQIEDASFLQYLDPCRLLHPLDQCARHFRPRLVPMRVHDPPARVRRFATKLEISARLEIELRAGCRQFANARRTLFDQNFDCFRVSESGTGCQRVLSMELR